MFTVPGKGIDGKRAGLAGSSYLPPTQKSPHFNLPRHLPQAPPLPSPPFLLFFPLRESLRVLLSLISFPSVLSYSPSTTTHHHHGCSLRNLARYVNHSRPDRCLDFPSLTSFFVCPFSLRRLKVLRSPIPHAASVAYLDEGQSRHDPLLILTSPPQ
jgi:hypothetical protein